MSDGIVFSEETSALLKDWIGDALKPKVPFIVRGLVKPTLGITIGLISKYADKIVPDKVDMYINDAITKAKDGDFDGAGCAVGAGIEVLVSAKSEAGSVKEKFFVNVGETIMTGLEYAIEVKKGS